MSIFQSQHTYLKICYTALVFIIFFYSKASVVGGLFALNIIFFLPSIELLKAYLKTLLRLSILWICYLVSALLFGVPFLEQVNLLLRLFLILQVSVYLHRSFCAEYFLFDTRRLMRYGFFSSLYYFFSYIFQIFKILRERFVNAGLSDVPMKKRVSKGYLESIMVTLKSVFDDTDTIKSELREVEIDSQLYRPLLTFSNLYLLVMVSIYVLALSM